MYSRNRYEREQRGYSIPSRYDGSLFRTYGGNDSLTNGVNEVIAAEELRMHTGINENAASTYEEVAHEEKTDTEIKENSPQNDPIKEIFEKISCDDILIAAVILVLANDNADGKSTLAIIALLVLLAL